MKRIAPLCLAIFILCISQKGAAHPVNQSTPSSENLPRPLYYDEMDGTDVLAIPSDSSAWDQEDEYEGLEKQEKENSYYQKK